MIREKNIEKSVGKMRRITAIINVFMIVSLLMMGCSKARAMPQDLAEMTQEIVSDVKEQDNYVFGEIQRNIDVANALRFDIENPNGSDKRKILNDVIDKLEKVTASYEKLSGRREEIRNDLLKKVVAIEKLQEKVQVEIVRLNKSRNTYSVMQKTFSDPNPDVLRTRKAALIQTIEYIDMQLQLWNEFYLTEQQIKDETIVVQQRIDSFLSIIESSAILFREGLNLFKLQRDIGNALSLFTQDLPRMEQLSRDMEQSWSHLDMLVNTLTSMSIDISQN